MEYVAAASLLKGLSGLGAPWLALLGTIFGGAGLKFVEWLLNRGKTQNDTATALRNELREEMKNMRQEIKDLDASLDEWKGKYYDLLDDFTKIRYQLAQDTAEIAEKVTKEELKKTRTSRTPKQPTILQYEEGNE